MKLVRRLLVIVFVVVMVHAGSSDWISADEPNESIRSDCERQFPQCNLFIPGSLLGLNPDSARVEVRIGDDLQATDLPELAPVNLPVPTYFAFDEYKGVRELGLSGKPKSDEFKDTVASFCNLVKDLELQDGVVVAATKTGNTPRLVDQTGGILFDNFCSKIDLYELNLTAIPTATSFYRLIETTLDNFDAKTGGNIVLFSDGYEKSGDGGQDNLIARAKELGVKIHPVMLVSPQLSQARQDEFANRLRRIAQQTGGVFALYTGPDALTKIWNDILSQSIKGVVSFTLDQADVQEASVTVNGVTQTVPLKLPDDIQPPRIEVLSPVASTVIPVDDAQLTVRLNIEFPDGYGALSERVEAVKVYIDQQPILVIDQPPFDEITLPIGNLSKGEYSLSVHVKDKYTGTVEASPISLTKAGSSFWWWVVTIGLTAVALGPLVLILLRRKSRGPVFESKPKEDNEDILLNRDSGTIVEAGDVELFPAATLVKVRGGEELPQIIPLHRQVAKSSNQWKIGRLAQYSELIIPDNRISHLHATIIEEAGEFRLRDEGSKGKSYLNKRLLEPRMPELLKAGDIINFNAVAYRFETEDEHSDKVPYSTPDADTLGTMPAPFDDLFELEER